MVVMIEVKPYLKADGYRTRYWAVYVDGELLAVVLYRKGAQAIADMFARVYCRKEAGGAA
jgi:hypothetical protein